MPQIESYYCDNIDVYGLDYWYDFILETNKKNKPPK